MPTFDVPSLPLPDEPTRAIGEAVLVRQVTNGSRADRDISSGQTMTDWVRLRLSRKRVPLELGEAMMGYPDGWTELEPLEMPSSHKSRSTSDD